MHDPQRTGEPLVLQIGVERLELRGGQHALVDECLAGQAWEVDRLPARPILSRAFGSEFVLSPLADHVAAALQGHGRHVRGPAHEQLPEGRHRVAGQRTQ